MNKKELYLWAKKGYGIFNYTTAYRPAVEKLIGEGSLKFGFKSDGGEAFKAMFPEKDVFSSPDELKEILPKVNSAEVIGNAIVSKWETIDKDLVWQFTPEANALLKWFMRMFIRILDLTDEHSEFIYCSVEFVNPSKMPTLSKRYTYISDEESISEGDTVIVPVGRAFEEEPVIVKSVKRFPADKTPIHPIKLKHILRKVS